MSVRHGLSVLCTLTLVASLLACKSEKPAEEPPSATIDPNAPPLISSRGPESPGLPAGHPPVGQGEPAIVWQVPAGWVEETPSSSMRRGQYRVPGPGGDAELAIFYFGAGQGGDADANAQRWANQFAQPGGGDPLEAMKTQTLDVQGTKVLLVETTGTYSNTAMNPGDVAEKPGYALLGAVVPGPDANWFFKMTGPEATVKAKRAEFLQLLQSIKKGS